MKTIKEQAIDLLEDIYFSIVHEFDLPIQAFDRVNYRDNIEYLKKVAAEQGLQCLVSKYFYQATKELFPNHPPQIECKKSHKFSALFLKLRALTHAIKNENEDNFSELDYLYAIHYHQVNIEEYLGFTYKHMGRTHIESIALRFSSENTKYKKYIRLKKETLFFYELEKLFKERDEKWSSVYEAIASTQDHIENEFRKFDIEWVKSEILYKENFLKIIPKIYTKPIGGYVVDERTGVLHPSTMSATDQKEVKADTKRTHMEIAKLSELLNWLDNNSGTNEKIEKLIPYNSDSLSDTLKKLLNSNKDLKRKISKSG